MNKIGGKKGILIAFILGLIVVGFSVYFLFDKYFNQTELDYETCRESLFLRANSPEASLAITTVSTKSLPVKCKTEVIDIDFENVSKAENIITSSLAGCWNLFGKGQQQFFAGASWSRNTFCAPCARIHFNEEVKEYYSTHEIDVQNALTKKMPQTTTTFYDYLKSGLKFTKYDGGNKFKIEGDGSDSRIILPKKIEPNNGDIFIFNQQTVISSGKFDSYIFYFQADQEDPNPFSLMKDGDHAWSEGGLLGWSEALLCDNNIGVLA